MKTGLILKILAGVAVASGGIATITVTAIKFSSKQDSTDIHDENDSSSTGILQDSKVEINNLQNNFQQTFDNNLTNVSSQDNNPTTQKDDEIKDDSVISFFAVVSTSNKDLKKVDQFTNDYQCKFDNKDAFDCTISIPKINKTLKHSSVDEFMKDDDSKTVNKEELKKKDNVFKIVVKNNNDVSKIDLNNQVFHVIKKDSVNEQFFKFITLFTMKDNKLHEKSKISKFIFKSNEETKKEISASGNQKCFATIQTSGYGDECSIYSFSNAEDQSNLKKLTFEGLNNNISIEKDKNYVISFDESRKSTLTKNIVFTEFSGTVIGTYNVKPVGGYFVDNAFQHLFFLD